ncbi:MAG: hypothetical protein IPP66_19035 [Anaerolineales bacterium]|nr:hypothetical protein [Anaerolineales bacterium]
MNIVVPKMYWRFFVILFFTGTFLFLFFHALFLMSTPTAPDTWLVGDWLINYHGGFVRRGLIGEIFLDVSQWLGIEIVTLVVVTQLIAYLVFFISTCRLSLDATFSASSFMLICSPAFILFPILDPQGGFRKEILFLALLSALCVYLLGSKAEVTNRLLVFVGGVSLFIVLNHEMMAAYLPYILCAFIIHGKGFENTPRKVAFLVPAMMVAVLLVLFAKGDNKIVVAICDSLKPNLPLDCIHSDVPGSISLLDDGVFLAHDLVFKSIQHGGLFMYMAVTVLSFVPLAVVWSTRRAVLFQMNKKRQYWLATYVLFAFLASAPLFWVASDYGRLVYIHVSCLSLLSLMAIRDTDNAPLRLSYREVAIWAVALLFVSSWRLPHWGASFEKAFPFIKNIGLFLNN